MTTANAMLRVAGAAMITFVPNRADRTPLAPPPVRISRHRGSPLVLIAVLLVLCGCSTTTPAPVALAPGATTAPTFYDPATGVGITPPAGWNRQPGPNPPDPAYIVGFARPDTESSQSQAPAQLVIVGARAAPSLDQSMDVFIVGAQQKDPGIRQLGRDRVVVASGQPGLVATFGTPGHPEGLTLSVNDGPNVYFAMAGMPEQDFPRYSPALRAAMLSLTIDRASARDPDLRSTITTGLAHGAGLLAFCFAVLAATWWIRSQRITAPKTWRRPRLSTIPGWVWIGPPAISLMLFATIKPKTPPDIISGQLCLLALLITCIAVAIRWLRRRRRHTRPPSPPLRTGTSGPHQ